MNRRNAKLWIVLGGIGSEQSLDGVEWDQVRMHLQRVKVAVLVGANWHESPFPRARLFARRGAFPRRRSIAP